MSNRGRVILILAAVVVAVAAFVVLQSGGDDDKEKSSTTGSGSSATVTAKAPATPATQRIAVKDGKPVGGVQKVTVTKGDQVRLIVSSPDTSQEIHVHGYDLKRELAPGRPATFDFKASNEGAFEIELEGTATKIADLEVQPG